MATVIIMPKQGQSVESCIITEFRKKKGDAVSKGDILFAYETDKASFEEESPVDGILLDVFFDEGDEVPVLTNVCVIGNEGESTDEFQPANNQQKPEKEQVIEPENIAVPEKEITFKETVKSENKSDAGISPRARNLSAKEGLDISSISGTGPQGRIIERDIIAAVDERGKITPLAKQVASETGAPANIAGSGLAGTITSKDITSFNPVYSNDFEIKPLSNMRKIIAKAMHASLQNSAQLTHHLGADARRLLELRKKAKALEINITINDMICYAVILALKKFPRANAHFLGDNMKIFNKVHLGLAVDTERGLMVPVIKNADDLTLQGLSSQFKEVAEACRKGNVNPELLSSEAASFTVSNLGNYGVEIFTPVINLPQVAILGVNTIIPRPKDLGDGVYGFVPYLGLSLTYDHRALDGGEATRFVKQVAIEIENLSFEM